MTSLTSFDTCRLPETQLASLTGKTLPADIDRNCSLGSMCMLVVDFTSDASVAGEG